MTRRDMCHLIGKRAMKLDPFASLYAWESLAAQVEAFGEKDVPKFLDLLRAFRLATIQGKQKAMAREEDVHAQFETLNSQPSTLNQS